MALDRLALRCVLAALLAAAFACASAPAAALASHDAAAWEDEGWDDEEDGEDWVEPSPGEDDAGWEDDWEAEAVADPAVPDDVVLPAVPVAELPGAPGPAPARPKRAGAVNPAKVPYGRLIATTARRHGVPVALLTALVWQESAFRPRARSHAGARGLTQLMPATARDLGVRNSYDPRQNMSGGARYLAAQLRRFGSKRLALAAYNAGPGAVSRYRGIPPYAETRTYVRRVLAYEARLKRSGVR